MIQTHLEAQKLHTLKHLVLLKTMKHIYYYTLSGEIHINRDFLEIYIYFVSSYVEIILSKYLLWSIKMHGKLLELFLSK